MQNKCVHYKEPDFYDIQILKPLLMILDYFVIFAFLFSKGIQVVPTYWHSFSGHSKLQQHWMSDTCNKFLKCQMFYHFCSHTVTMQAFGNQFTPKIFTAPHDHHKKSMGKLAGKVAASFTWLPYSSTDLQSFCSHSLHQAFLSTASP